MKLKEFFADVKTDTAFSGFVTTDNMVLAVDISAEQNADVDDYAVAHMGFTSRSSSLNPEEKTTSYYYHGKSTMKTGNQRTIDWEAERYVGDEFQDFAVSHEMKYAKGQKSIVNYTYFNVLTGCGEKGKGTLIISNDGSGAPEENLIISGSIKKSGEEPVQFTYEGLGGYTAVKEQPSDWTTAYANYFTRKNGAFTAVAGDSAPVWAESKYYSKKTETANETITVNETETETD